MRARRLASAFSLLLEELHLLVLKVLRVSHQAEVAGRAGWFVH